MAVLVGATGPRALGIALTLWAIPNVAVAEPRCGTRAHTPPFPVLRLDSGDSSNCSATWTNPDPSYADGGLLEFKLVVHVIENADGTEGVLSDERIAEQVRVLNEDFRGTASRQGLDTQIGFNLATVDPSGAPTSGITRDNDDAWFRDQQKYWQKLAWDPKRYINVYTNNAQGLLGYSYLPADPESAPGAKSDRIVIDWRHIGPEPGVSSNRGRTLTHEMGHYLGLDHPFAPNPTTPETFICEPADPPDCYESGDLVCDTPSEDSPNDQCDPRKTCGSDDAVDNFMDYTPDGCMRRFTTEQMLRMRCSVLGYRPDGPWPAGRLGLVELARDGQTAHLSVELSNDSAFAHTFAVAVESANAEFAWSETTVPPDAVALEPSETWHGELFVTLPQDGDGELTLRADSDANERSARLPVTVAADPEPLLRLSTDETHLLASPAAPARFALAVSNDGVIAEDVDIVADGAFATRVMPESPLPLPAFESRSLDVEVTVPNGAAPGVEHVVTLTATSERKPEVSQTERVHVQVARWVQAELEPNQATLDARPGQTGAVTFTLDSSGNAEESYAIEAVGSLLLGAWPRASRLGPFLPRGRSGPASVTVDYQVSEDAPVGAQLQLRLLATATGDTEPAASASLDVAVVDTGRVDLLPRVQTRAGNVGDEERFELLVVNHSSEDDRYAVTVESESELVSAVPARVSVPAGESRMLGLTLSSEATGEQHTTVTVRSVTHPERSQRAELFSLWQPPGRNVDAGVPPADPPASGCGCAVPRRRGSHTSKWGVWAALGAWLWRTRGKRRSARLSRSKRHEPAIGHHQHGQVDALGGSQLGQ